MSGVTLYEGNRFNVPEKVAASQTIHKNDFLVMNADGLIEKAGAASTGFYGIADHDSITEDAGTTIMVAKGRDDMVFRMTGSTTLAQTDIGDAHDMAVSSGKQTVNLAAASTKVFLVVGVPNRVNGVLSTDILVKVNKWSDSASPNKS